MKARVFTEDGVEQFREALAAVREGARQELPDTLVNDPGLTVPFAADLDLPRVGPETSRYLWALAIDGLLADREPPDYQRKGFWAWLSAYYFDVLCPVDGHGRRHVGEDPRYIPELDNYRRFYRHLLLGPWYVARAHRADPVPTKVVLAGPLAAPGEMPAQIMSRQELITSPAVVRAAYVMYFDDGAGRLRRGSGGSGPGSPRRFADVLGQLALTFDLHAVEPRQLLELLPKEFNRFLKH